MYIGKDNIWFLLYIGFLLMKFIFNFIIGIQTFKFSISQLKSVML